MTIEISNLVKENIKKWFMVFYSKPRMEKTAILEKCQINSEVK